MKNKLSAKVKEIVDAETRKFLDELPRTIRQNLTKASLAIIGVDQSWGRDSVKVSDNGSAFFSALLSEEVKKHCKKIVPVIAKAALKMFTDNRLAQLTNSLAEHYYYAVRKQVEAQLDEFAKKHAKIICDKMERHFNVELLENLDLDDPESFEGKVGEFALEAVAQDLATGQNRIIKHVVKKK